MISFKNSFYNYLGKPFFKKFNLVFNQDSRQLAIYSFYEATNKKIQKISLFIPMILIIIFIILLSVFIYALSVYRLKKKKKNEIIEEYEYTPSQEINSQNKVKDTRLLEMTSSQII